MTESTPAQIELRVISWNIWGLPVGAANRAERIRSIAEVLPQADADIIAIQEAWMPGDVAVLESALVRAGYAVVHFRSFPFGSGLLTASRLPMRTEGFVPFRYRGKPYKPWHGDWFGGKGAGVVQIETGAGELVFVNTHLHARYGSDEYLAGRLTEVTDLAGAVDEFSVAGDQRLPLVVAGDLNARPRDLPFALLRDLAGVVPPADGPNTIDWILARGGTGVACTVRSFRARDRWALPVSEDRTRLSDHDAVEGVLVLETTERSLAGLGTSIGASVVDASEILGGERARVARAVIASQLLLVGLSIGIGGLAFACRREFSLRWEAKARALKIALVCLGMMLVLLLGASLAYLSTYRVVLDDSVVALGRLR